MLDIAYPVSELFVTLSEFVLVYGYLFVFISTFFLGEFGAITSFMLVGQGELAPLQTFVLVVVAFFVADVFWFLVGALFFRHISEPQIIPIKKLRALDIVLNNLVKRHLFFFLVYMKFLFGLRLLLLLYLSFKKVPFYIFILFDTLSIIFFSTILFTVGWLFGVGIYNALPAYRFVVTLLLALVITLVVFSLGKTLIYSTIHRKSKP